MINADEFFISGGRALKRMQKLKVSLGCAAYY